jgi:hypothetical protein
MTKDSNRVAKVIPTCSALAAALLLCPWAWSTRDIPLDCGEATGPMNFGDQCNTAPGGYSTPTDACRAAQQGLLTQMIHGLGVQCQSTGCLPGTCHPAIWYWDPGQLTTAPFGSPSGGYGCHECWTGGSAQVMCTPCDV